MQLSNNLSPFSEVLAKRILNKQLTVNEQQTKQTAMNKETKKN
jgi:hypothetical protein